MGRGVGTAGESCEWYKVYDIAEAIWRALEHDPDRQQEFEHELNRFFREKGIGWELKNPDGIVFRGSEAFGAATSEAAQVLKETGRETAAAEIHEALRDISRRPDPDRTGAIQHAIAALECTARDVTGDSKATLGALVPKLDLPKPLDVAVEKLWDPSFNVLMSSTRKLHLSPRAAASRCALAISTADISEPSTEYPIPASAGTIGAYTAGHVQDETDLLRRREELGDYRALSPHGRIPVLEDEVKMIGHAVIKLIVHLSAKRPFRKELSG